MKKLLIFFLAGLLFACNPPGKKPESAGPVVPEWCNNAVLYEVNIRQYTPEGTFNAFAKHLPRLKNLGVDILWIMPVNPISEKNRKGSLGSYYSVKDYKAINPEFGTMNDFKQLVNQAHELGMKVIIDWVANHTGWDNQWIYDHPDWYTTDSTGAIISPDPDWTDIADLNFESKPMRRAMIEAMNFWVKETDIDGFRCDVAWGVPQDFWEEARASIDSVKPVYMLAEDEDHPGFLKKAFDSNYAWELHHILNDVAQGKKTAQDIKAYFDGTNKKYAPGSFPIQFITNHDENSWNGSEYERMGDAVKTFATLTFTIEGMPLLYSGQEAGLKKRLRFFEKDTINWADTTMQAFYRSLIILKHTNPALWNGNSGAPIVFAETSAPDQTLAFTRTKENNQLLAIFNLSPKPAECSVKLPAAGTYQDYFSGETKTFGIDTKLDLDKWAYRVYVQK